MFLLSAGAATSMTGARATAPILVFMDYVPLCSSASWSRFFVVRDGRKVLVESAKVLCDLASLYDSWADPVQAERNELRGSLARASRSRCRFLKMEPPGA